jgi:hypothetical protein
MWANVWYYLASQLITLAAAFGLSLCFESPFIRLEKLWVGALLQAILPAAQKGGGGKVNGNIPPHQTTRILDDIIERLEKEDLEKRMEKEDDGPMNIGEQDEHSKIMKEQEDYSKEMKGSIEDLASARSDHEVAAESVAVHKKGFDVEAGQVTVSVAEVHVEANPPSYEETIK